MKSCFLDSQNRILEKCFQDLKIVNKIWFEYWLAAIVVLDFICSLNNQYLSNVLYTICLYLNSHLYRILFYYLFHNFILKNTFISKLFFMLDITILGIWLASRIPSFLPNIDLAVEIGDFDITWMTDYSWVKSYPLV